MPIQNLLGSRLESQSLSGLYPVTELTARIISHPRISLLRQFPPHIAYGSSRVHRRIRGYKAMTFVIQTPSKPWGGSFCIQCESKMIRKVPSFSSFQVGQKCFCPHQYSRAPAQFHNREHWFVSCSFAADNDSTTK